jgi:hypothetical protein
MNLGPARVFGRPFAQVSVMCGHARTPTYDAQLASQLASEKCLLASPVRRSNAYGHIRWLPFGENG